MVQNGQVIERRSKYIYIYIYIYAVKYLVQNGQAQA